MAFGFYASYQYSYPEDPAALEAENPMQSRYHICIEEGKVIVRLEDGSVYETTDICEEFLPPSVREKISRGYILESRQELYSFLENYSS